MVKVSNFHGNIVDQDDSATLHTNLVRETIQRWFEMGRRGRGSTSASFSSKESTTSGDGGSVPLVKATSAASAVGAGAKTRGSTQTDLISLKGNFKSSSSIHDWLFRSDSFQGPLWILGCMIVGLFVGFAIGAGYFDAFIPNTSDYTSTTTGSPMISPWKQRLANRIRATATYQFLTFRGAIWDDWLDRFSEWAQEVERDLEAEAYAQNPSHPRVFAVLREAVVREKGGYVHPDLGFLVPAPSGAARGIGMVSNGYHYCQVRCIPGVANEKRDFLAQLQEMKKENTTLPSPTDQDQERYLQEELLIRVPLSFQMTRSVAMEVLLAIIPPDVQKKSDLTELDDAALLVLLLANERGVGRFSRWFPYIASMPPQPSCGYAAELRPYMLDTIHAMGHEIGIDVTAWADEMSKATQYSQKIVDGLNKDYGSYLSTPEGMSSAENIRWALCQVASRATAGSEKHGSLRLVPILDLVNHDANAGGFFELTGKERYRNGDFVEATEEDSGSFVVRSIRLGRRKPLRKGQELLANYNVPHYSPLDWFVSLGFVPPERHGPWRKVEPVLPRVRTDGPFSESATTSSRTRKDDLELLERIQGAEL